MKLNASVTAESLLRALRLRAHELADRIEAAGRRARKTRMPPRGKRKEPRP